MRIESWKADKRLTEILKICLAPNKDVEFLLNEWESKYSISEIDGGLIRFIPFLYRRVLDLNVKPRDYNILRGVYFKNWWVQTVFQKNNLSFLSILDESFPPFAILKGVALQNTVYSHDPRTRPCDDVDIFVYSNNRLDAAKSLLSNGFELDNVYSLEYVMNYRKSSSFKKGELSIDLNWGLHEYAKDTEYQKKIEFHKVEIGKVGFNVLSETINLVHTIIHGAGWNSVSSTRWILDAALLIQSEAIDWSLFVDIVITNGWQHPLVDQLNYLSEFEVDIPSEVIQEIAKSKIDYWGKAMYFYQSQPSQFARRVHRLIYSDYLTFITNNGFKNSIFNYIKFEPLAVTNLVKQYSRILLNSSLRNFSETH
jgi:hypothetical protein